MREPDFYPLTIASTVPETDQALRIGFAVPPQLRTLFRYQQGQYLTLRLNINGEQQRRSYSICSAIGMDTPEIAVKRVKGGLCSNYINDHLQPGDSVDVMPPQGNFFVPLRPEIARNYLFVAAGSGITPVLSNLRSIFAVEPASTATLLYGNQRTGTILFREALSFLKNRYMARFHWINVLSRESQGIAILDGRLNNRKGAELNQRLIDLQSFDAYFICGPEAMISGISRGLREFGVEEERIHYELFSSSTQDARIVVAKHRARARKYKDKTSEVKLIFDGRTFAFALGADEENLLDAGIRHGLDLPFSCKSGICATCKARLLEGQVDMDITHGLDATELQSGLILTCQSHPISATVVLDFDR